MTDRKDLEQRLAEYVAGLPQIDPAILTSDGDEVGVGYEMAVHPDNSVAPSAERRVAGVY